jgi:hypothetical protein
MGLIKLEQRETGRKLQGEWMEDFQSLFNVTKDRIFKAEMARRVVKVEGITNA